MNAKTIEIVVNTGASHCLFSKTGTWYHLLTSFPGVLYDLNGYICFMSRHDLVSSKFVRETKELNIRNGIAKMPGYKKYTNEQRLKIFGK